MHLRSKFLAVWGCLIILGLTTVANAEFKPFGNGIEEFFFTASNQQINMGLGFRPLKEINKLSWGPELKLTLDDQTGRNHLARDNTLLGVHITYPVLQVDSLITRIDANSVLHLKVSGLWDLGGDDGLVPGLGVMSTTEMYKSETQEIKFLMTFDSYSNSDVLDDQVFGLGFIATWKDE